jgi:hypothetical protein
MRKPRQPDGRRKRRLTRAELMKLHPLPPPPDPDNVTFEEWEDFLEQMRKDRDRYENQSM